MHDPSPQPLTAAPPKPNNVGHSVVPLIPQDFDTAWRFADAFARGGLTPPGLKTAEQIFAVIIVGTEFGLSPMQAMQNIAMINNRPAIWGDAQLAIVQASGLLEDIEERFEGEEGKDDFKAVCRAKRKDRPTEVVRAFSVADAKKASLFTKTGTPWITNPKRMLQMRARAFCLRDGFADVLKGLYSREELIGEPMIDVTPAGGVASAAELNRTYLSIGEAPSAAAEAGAAAEPAPEAESETAVDAAEPDAQVAAQATEEEGPILIGRDAAYTMMSVADLKTCTRQAVETLSEYEPDDGAGRLGFWADINGAGLMLALGRKGLSAEKARLEAAVPRAA